MRSTAAVLSTIFALTILGLCFGSAMAEEIPALRAEWDCDVIPLENG